MEEIAGNHLQRKSYLIFSQRNVASGTLNRTPQQGVHVGDIGISPDDYSNMNREKGAFVRSREEG